MSAVRLAATVILARPPFEVYLARRSARSAFAPDAFVFPGGTIDAADASPQMQSRSLGLDDARVSAEFRAAISNELRSSEPAVARAEARALLVAALRELFEEAGVLFARTADGRSVDAAMLEGRGAAAERAGIRNGDLPFADFLASHDWFADTGALTLFSHWITPPSEPRRYNTHFFFAARAVRSSRACRRRRNARWDMDRSHVGAGAISQRHDALGLSDHQTSGASRWLRFDRSGARLC